MKKIEVLYHDLCDIYAEPFNMEYLHKCNKEIELVKRSHKEEPYFVGNEVDMVYIGCTTEKRQEYMLEKLMPHRERIKKLIDDGCVFLVTGNSIEMFGKYIKDEDRKIEALGIFDFYSERYMNQMRHYSQMMAKFEDMTIIGHKSQFSFSYGDFDHPFLILDKGTGMNPDTNKEGIHVNNFFATYSLGPFLILNPLFTKYILRLLGLDDKLYLEKEIIEAYEYRVKQLERTLK